MSDVIRLSAEGAEQLAKDLGAFRSETPRLVKNAVNRTAKRMQKLLQEKAKKEFTVKGVNFNHALKLNNATLRNLTATLQSRGYKLMLADFKVSPPKPPAVVNEGAPSAKAKVLAQRGGLKPLDAGGIKAFVNYFSYEKKNKAGEVTGSGKKLFVAKRLSKARLPLKVFYSVSMPQMIGNEEHVYNQIALAAHKAYVEELQTQLRKHIDKMGRTAK